MLTMAPPSAQMAAMNIAGAGPADGERRGARERGSRHAVSFTESLENIIIFCQISFYTYLEGPASNMY